jgi:hypothetical protein
VGVVGGAAGAHGVIAALDGMRVSAALTFIVVAAGFIGFGLFARATGMV